MIMSKRTLIDEIAKMKNCSRVEALEFIDAFQSIMTEHLLNEGKIQIHNLGTFSIRERAGRSGRNPRTGEPIDIPARRAVTFKPSKNLVHRLNPKKQAH
jgi:DNA-binding protein HU-beta